MRRLFAAPNAAPSPRGAGFGPTPPIPPKPVTFTVVNPNGFGYSHGHLVQRLFAARNAAPSSGSEAFGPTPPIATKTIYPHGREPKRFWGIPTATSCVAFSQPRMWPHHRAVRTSAPPRPFRPKPFTFTVVNLNGFGVFPRPSRAAPFRSAECGPIIGQRGLRPPPRPSRPKPFTFTVVNPNGFGVFPRPSRAAPFLSAECGPITAQRGLRPPPPIPTKTVYPHGREPKRFWAIPTAISCGAFYQRRMRPHHRAARTSVPPRPSAPKPFTFTVVNPNGFGVFPRPSRAEPFPSAECGPVTAQRGLRPPPRPSALKPFTLTVVNPNGFGVFRRPPRAAPFRSAECGPVTAQRGLRPHPTHPDQNRLPSRS